MAKVQKPNVPQKTAQNDIQKRLKNLFAGQEPPTYMTVRQTEELKARLKELEAQIAKRQAEMLDQKPDESQEVEKLRASVAELQTRLGEQEAVVSPENVVSPNSSVSPSPLRPVFEAHRHDASRPELAGGISGFVGPNFLGSLRSKLVASFVSVVIVIAIMGFAVYTDFRNQIRQDIRQRLLNVVSIMALQQDGDLHASITGPESMSSNAYKQMMAQDIAILKTMPDLTYIYTMRMNEQGQIYFIIDARQGEDEAVDVGTVYQEPSAFLSENFATLDHPVVEDEFYTDEWGTFLSAYAPIYREDGTREGIIGVDISADKVIERERTALYRVLGVTLAAMSLAAGLGLYLGTVFTRPITNLSSVAQRIAKGDLSARAAVESRDEIGVLAATFNNMASQLRNMIEALERRVAERTKDLEIASEVGRAITEKIANQYEMMAEAVEIIRSKFNLYYTQIYLVDPSGRSLVLKAGTGEEGIQLMRRSHSLPIGLGSINGRAASEKRAVIIEDTEKSAGFLSNPLLPLTRSEMAVPLMVAGQVVGVLDLQSEQPGALNETNLPAFTALAGQLAVAIQNASLFTQTMQARAELEEQARRLTAKGWQEFLDGIERSEKIGFSYAQDEIVPVVEVEAPPVEAEYMLSTPIEVAGLKVGEICLVDEPDRVWTAEESKVIRATAAQVAQHVENLRLLAEAEKYRSEAEQALRRLTREGWEEYLQQSREMQTGFLYDGEKVTPVNGLEERETTLSSDIKVRGETIGQLSILDADDPTLSEEEQKLIASVAERLSAHIENLRLSQQTEQALAVSQKLAQREQALRQITAAVRSSTNLETILRTTAREVGSTLGRRVLVKLESQMSDVSASEPSSDDLSKAS